MKNPVIKQFRAIVVAHENNRRDDIVTRSDDEYYTNHEKIKANLRKFIDTQDFANLTRQDLLQLVHFVYLYQPMAFHSFAIKCDKQLSLLTN